MPRNALEPIDPLRPEELEVWYSAEQQKATVAKLLGRVGLTRRRAECFVRLWAYLLIKQQQSLGQVVAPPLAALDPLEGAVSCTCREAAELFYAGRERGSDRAAGLMLDKLLALGLISKQFDGNTLEITIQPLPELGGPEATLPELQLDNFDPRCDAIPVANLLMANYHWMNRHESATTYHIAELLRTWAAKYSKGMRVLRRCDNLNPVGFYLLYPTQKSSEIHFFEAASKGLYLGTFETEDPFEMAEPGDKSCRAIYIRSWLIDAPYREQGQSLFLADTQQVVAAMQGDFPNLCDLYTRMIYPGYEALIHRLGFQKASGDAQSSVYWVYLALDRFLAIDLAQSPIV